MTSIRKNMLPVFGIVWGIAGCTGLVSGQEIEVEARDAFRAMSEYLGGLDTFSFQAHEMLDDVTEEGIKVQYANLRRITADKPGRVTGDFIGDLVDRRLWYTNGRLTVYDREEQVYAELNVPDTIDETMDFLAERMGMVVPLSELLYGDVYDAMLQVVGTGRHLGMHYVGEERCHHLLFGQPGLVWQVWIHDGDRPLPAKIVMTYTDLPQQPQYIAVLTDWEVGMTLDNALFEPEIPANTTRIDVLQQAEALGGPR